MGEPEKDKGQVDPFNNMLKFYDDWTKAWSKTMSETVSTPRFVETMAQQMDGSLEFWSMIRKQVRETMEQYLQQMGLPTQGEVVSLAERLTQIEMRLDDFEAKIDQVLDQLSGLKNE